ncbi:MAG: phenylalanine--tRNA ligase subunit beta [Candidatus Hydrogenedentes bacterium]|nr:phenylalanine--tRNA ligase subunit beta [Candidatus Hydrogenedentota bacterium]
MNVSLNWLKEFVDIARTPDELAQDLTMLGLEIEAIERPGEGISNVIVGRILEIKKHPDADKLVVCKTDVGQPEPLQIVCGAKNMKEGDLVPTAVVGATLPGDFTITRRKMRGIESCGMMCSARELGMGKDHEGLLILPSDMPVGGDAVKLLGLDDVVYEIEVTPNRGDWASMIGVARELAALYGTSLRIPNITLNEGGEEARKLSSVTIENPDLCARYIGRVLTNVKIGPSPQWLAQRLTNAGQRPINNVVDITNFVLLETGHPLHAFDYDKLLENRIVVRCAKRGETIRTIDEQVRTLDPDMLVIADAKNPVAVAGVMGGFDSEVSESTVNIFLESAFFAPSSVRKTSRKLGMHTEASARFQRGADPEMARYAVDRAAALMQELAGATVAPGVIDEYPRPLPVVEVSLRYARANALVGKVIEGERQKAILESLCFKTIKADNQGCLVQVPTWRHDVKQEADLIEEIARMYGFENIEASIPRVRKNMQVFAPKEDGIREMRRFLTGLGLTELMSMTFTSPEEVQRCRLDGCYADMVALQNPLSENLQTMRTSLLPGLLSTASLNIRRGCAGLRAFEVGPTYRPASNGEELPGQQLMLGIVYTGLREDRHWSGTQNSCDLFDVKGLIEAIGVRFGLQLNWQEGQLPAFEKGQQGRVLCGETELGTLGRVSDEALSAAEIEQPVFLAELDLEQLLTLASKTRHFQAIPAYPASTRDMALILDLGVPSGDVLDTAKKAGGANLKSVSLFDVYTGKQVPEGKKSLALGFVFQSNERTLTETDVQADWDAILARLKADYGAVLR